MSALGPTAAPVTASVVIRTRDEGAWIGRCIDAVRGQSVPAAVVVVDSGSRDSTLREARARGVQVVEMAPGTFTYGGALNLGAAHASGEVVVALSAHAIPRDQGWLSALLAPFAEAAVAATYGRQLPHRGLDPFRAREVLRYWPAAGREDRPGATRYSNANGAFRRRLLEQHPFDAALPANEDDEWALWALAAGHRVVYVPGAAVFHSHAEGPRGVYRRQRALALAGGSDAKSWAATLADARRLCTDDMRLLVRRPRLLGWAPVSPVLRVAQVLGTRAGAAARGRGQA